MGVASEKSRAFAIRIVRLYQFLEKEKGEFILSRQLLRSGTSIGANLAEADYAVSRRDFLQKISISLKEAAETLYWLDLLYQTAYLTPQQYSSLKEDCSELLKMLTSAVKTSKSGV